MNWDTAWSKYWLLIPLLAALTPIGGVLSFSTIGFAWPGIISGILTAVLSLPVINYFQNRSLEKHKTEVTETANDLAALALQLSDEIMISKKLKEQQDKDSRIIEIDSDPEDYISQPETTRLRNKLR